ncbi:hypothetical protein HG530_015588 [Fusarium avenaceum]|nr:hypothetical protein HG530_015588 [Fusarium avenaceum]
MSTSGRGPRVPRAVNPGYGRRRLQSAESLSDPHRLEVLGDVERSFCLALDLVNGDAFCNLNESKTVGEINIKDTLVDSSASQRECALLDNLGVALLICVLHCHNNLGLAGVADKIHSTAEALDLSGKHPVGQITSGADLHGSQDGEVDATAADHAKALLATEYGSARLESHSLLTSVDQISVLGALLGVGVHAVLELLSGTTHNALTLGSCIARSQSLCSLRVVRVLGPGVFLDRLLLGALDDTLDVDARQVNGLRRDLTGLDNVLGFHNGHLCVAAHGTVEVVCGETELAVAKLVSLPGLDEGVVTVNALLEEIRLSLEDLDVLGSSLRGQLKLDLTSEVHLLKGLVFADIGGNHLADLLGLEKSAETETVRAGIVRDSCEAGDVGLLENLIDEGVGDTAETETTAEEGCVGLHVLESFLGGGEDLVDLGAASGG